MASIPTLNSGQRVDGICVSLDYDSLTEDRYGDDESRLAFAAFDAAFQAGQRACADPAGRALGQLRVRVDSRVRSKQTLNRP